MPTSRRRAPRSRFTVAALILGAAACFSLPAAADTRLAAIRARGHVTCGVVARVAGFTSFNTSGRAIGFEPDLCRAIAAAIFGDGEKVAFVPADAVNQFKSDASLDLVARRLTVTLQRDAGLGLLFSPVVFYDRTTVMVRTESAVQDPAALARRPICVRASSEAAEALVRHFSLNKLELTTVPHPTFEAAAKAFADGACEALAGDLSQLAAERAGRRDLAILPQTLSKEPLALLTRAEDVQFAAVVRWTIYALIAAEEMNVTAGNIGSRRRDPDPDVRRLIGESAGNGKALGLNERWAANAIRAGGNYGELFARHLGADSPLKLERGPNALWTQGGLLYAPPLR